MLNGADCSHWQSTFDATAFKAGGWSFVIHKCTQNTDFQDPQYATRKQQALDAGILWGSYHFLNPGNATVQADFYLSVVKPDGKTLLCLDYETGTVADAEEFVQRIHECTGVYPLLYTRASMILQQIGNEPTLLTNCKLWLASYTVKPVLPSQWSMWMLVQHTDGIFGPEPHSAPGIGLCDCDLFYGTFDQLRVAWQALSPTSLPSRNIRFVTANLLNVRAGPDISYKVVGQLRKGTQVNTTSEQGKWTSYTMPIGQTGWVASRYLT